MLKELYNSGKYDDLDLNCAESIVVVANDAYGLGFTNETIRFSSAFGGGMCIEEKCGVVTGALMILGYLFVEECAHKSDIMKPVVHSFLTDFKLKMQSSECLPLKKMYRTEESGCSFVIESSLEILENTVNRYKDFRIR